MKSRMRIAVLLTLMFSTAFSQSRTPQNHVRGMLHQTVYNTGELGRAFDRGDTGMPDGYSSLEWPSNSTIILDRTKYPGQHNSFGGGLYISGRKNGTVQTIACGAVTTTGNGQTVPIAGVYCDPGSTTRTENYPVLASGALNPSYNPNQAEEIIVAKWTTKLLKIDVTRTSRAWAFPGYDSFIIYEYDIVNSDSVDITDAFIGWGYGFCPSMFGYQRTYNRWAEGDLRSKDQFARFDLSRWMSYNHDRSGKPDTSFFNVWSVPGERGGLDSPQAVGILPLHYDYDHLAVKGQTNYPKGTDSIYVWDANNKLKQPYTNRYENANIDISKIQSWTDITSRKTSAFQGKTDSTSFPNQTLYAYWKGRAKPSWTLGWKQPGGHGYTFGPYTLPVGQHLHFTIAEVVGYGPGVAGDSVYVDLGGGSGSEATLGFHPVPSWYNQMSYPDATGNPPVIGSNYLQTHPLPWYVTPGVVSIRDVADRAIQMYTGNPLVKYDSLQFEPATTPAHGVYSTVPIPIPAPAMRVEDSPDIKNKIIWGSQVENFSNAQAAGRLKAGLWYYKILRAPQALGPWTVIDSTAKGDVRYYTAATSEYTVQDQHSRLSESYYYCVVSVDSLGKTSAMTNRIPHETQKGAVLTLGKVYVAPNPLIVTGGFGGSTVSGSGGDINDKIGFFGLPKKATIRIFSYSGQLIQTIDHDVNSYSIEWFQITRNNQMLASGVYFFTVDDLLQGKRATGKFVIIH